MEKKYKMFVISGTHWDREWYQTFEGYRKRLVFMIDELLDHMEKDKNYKYFHLDGTAICIEDYLEIRPENEERLRHLMAEGRIIAGPWYVMPDVFEVSGESIVRNLQKGFRVVEKFGGKPMKNGYVVDIFGHNSQMPQIYRGFGIDSAVLFRGVGEYPYDTFKWVGVDNSDVLCVYLDPERCYGNFYFAIRWPFYGRNYEKNEMIERMRQLFEFSKKRAVSTNMLMMDTMDHMEIEPRLAEILNTLNENIDEIEIIHSTVEDYVQAQYRSGVKLGEIRGELHNTGVSGLNNRTAKGCLSAGVHIKQMNNLCETMLIRWAEPFDVIANWVKPRNRKRFFDIAWTYLLQNHPHDSICGCSITRVHQDNEYRYHQAMDIANEMINMEFKDIASSIDTTVTGTSKNIVLFNALPNNYEGIVEAELEFDAGSQGNFRIFDSAGNEIPYQILDMKKNTIRIDHKIRYIYQGWPKKDIYKVAFKAWIPSLGYNTYGYEEYKNIGPFEGDFTFREYHAPMRYLGSMQTGHNRWENDFLEVTFDKSGSLSVLNKKSGRKYNDLLMFESTGEIGRAWQIEVPVRFSRYLSLNGRSDFFIESNGPLVAEFKITNYVDLPEKMDEAGISRSGVLQEHKIDTLIKMKKDSPMLEFSTTIDNRIEEHRMRVLFPTYMNTETFDSLTPFYFQERAIKKPDASKWSERESGVYSNQGVVMIRDSQDYLALYNKGMYEIEVTEDKSHTLALGLFRSFKDEVARDKGEMTLMKRPMTFEYALEFGSGEKLPGNIIASGEMWRTGCKWVHTDSHKGKLEMVNSFMKLEVPDVVLSSFRAEEGGMTVLRIYNCKDNNTSGELSLFTEPKRVFLMNLNEEIEEEIRFKGNVIPLKLNPAEILTLGFEMAE